MQPSSHIHQKSLENKWSHSWKLQGNSEGCLVNIHRALVQALKMFSKNMMSRKIISTNSVLEKIRTTCAINTWCVDVLQKKAFPALYVLVFLLILEWAHTLLCTVKKVTAGSVAAPPHTQSHLLSKSIHRKCLLYLHKERRHKAYSCVIQNRTSRWQLAGVSIQASVLTCP